MPRGDEPAAGATEQSTMTSMPNGQGGPATVTDVQAPPLPDLKTGIIRHATYSLGRIWGDLTPHELFWAVSMAVRDRVIGQMIRTERRYRRAGAKRAYYISLEFLMGRTLGNTLVNLGLMDEAQAVLEELGVEVDDVLEAEPDAALGNGGLGRLAACFLDSMATLDLPGFGYGINYEFGLFHQQIREGRQHEMPDSWRAHGTPWQIERPSERCIVPLYGRVEKDGERSRWVDCQAVVGVPFDMPIVGYGGKTVNTLRLFAARASDEFDMRIFNQGDYIRAVEAKALSETISKVLYPSDRHPHGQELRLIQEYFLVSCAMTDIFRKLPEGSGPEVAAHAAVQLNDTHPALAVAELMRVLVDHEGVSWEKAWDATRATLAYTNHTLMPEALEKWPIELLGRVLPRHLEIIYRINQELIEVVSKKHPGDGGKLARMSIIEEGSPKHARMAHLAIVGSHSVNGVAAVHSELVKTDLVPDFAELYPDRFNNKTNGVTPRRWIMHANPGLSDLVTEKLGGGWATDLERLHELEPLADDAGFLEAIDAVKLDNKRQLAQIVDRQLGFAIDPHAMFDVQIKRIHEYKRQLLNVLHVVDRYLRIVEDGQTPTPRVHLFAGKAAPGYDRAKDIIALICAVADSVNADKRCDDLMKVVFMPDYSVSKAEGLIPAADLSEQVSTAGFEASGTGNMKFAMNGALTIGTLDGANIEMREAIGAEHMFIFGNTVDQIRELREGGKRPRAFYEASPTARRIIDAVSGGVFSPGDPGRFAWVRDALVEHWDPYFHLADLGAYLSAQQHADELFGDRRAWTRHALFNIARMGGFSSDRTIKQYAEEIWGVSPVQP